MSAGGFILLFAFLAVVVLVVLWPLLQRQQADEGDSGQEFGKMPIIQQLRAEREAVLQAVRELDFDYQTGKLLEADYLEQREHLMEHGVEILRQIEAAQSAVIENAVNVARTAPQRRKG